MQPRILLADDHPMVLAGIQKVLESEFEVVAMVEDGRTLVKVAQELQPDVIVLDMSMPLLNGLEAAQQLTSLLPACQLIFLTMHGDVNYVRQAFESGASGFLLKRSAASELSQAIHTVLQGRTYVTPLISQVRGDEVGDSGGRRTIKQDDLTSRQREVLQLLAERHSTKEIATLLRISVKTVEFHKSRIMERLGLHTTADLAKYAVTRGLTEQKSSVDHSC